jgi:hypothetical protein
MHATPHLTLRRLLLNSRGCPNTAYTFGAKNSNEKDNQTNNNKQQDKQHKQT